MSDTISTTLNGISTQITIGTTTGTPNTGIYSGGTSGVVYTPKAYQTYDNFNIKVTKYFEINYDNVKTIEDLIELLKATQVTINIPKSKVSDKNAHLLIGTTEDLSPEEIYELSNKGLVFKDESL